MLTLIFIAGMVFEWYHISWWWILVPIFLDAENA
jgi:hypothetical protein